MSEIELKGLKGEKDFPSLEKEREKIIHSSSSKPINTDFAVNKLAEKLHPQTQYVKVAKVISENEDVQTFVLVPNKDYGTLELAPFLPGQYISICVEINGGIYKRPMTISCSPRHALNGEYMITIQRVEDGIVSNYFLDEVEEGYTFQISAPLGNFCYSSIRDEKHILALAGGSGITPFISMAEAIYDGSLHCDLTIIYGANTKEDLLFREKLEDITCKIKNVNVIYVLSEEDDNEFLNGYIDKELIEKYYNEETSIFVSGPISFYSYINDILKEMDIPKKKVRHDLFMGEIELKNNNEFSLTVISEQGEFNIKCHGKETLLQAMEKSGIDTLSRCHVGVCGFCRSKLISGKVKTIDESTRAADKIYNYIHPCVTYPESDLVIKLPN